MSRTIVKKKHLQKLISESLKKRKVMTSNTPTIDFVRMNEEINRVHNKIRIGIVKEGITGLDIRNYVPILSESFYGTGSNRNHPGESAANGVEEVIKGLKKAYEFVKDQETGKMIMNSIVRLSNTLSVIGTYMGSGKSQRGVDDEWLYSQLSDIPYPGVEDAEESKQGAERMKKSYLSGF
tara:strand:- start:424 stop:963 length:540 start_codon:yes stop_codon:yes gene_type:complete